MLYYTINPARKEAKMTKESNTIQPSAYCNYLGKKTPIYVVINENVKKSVIRLENGTFVCECPKLGQVDLYPPLKTFYKKAAKKHIEKRLRHYQQNFKEKYKSFTISSDDSRWGSCDSKRQLTFHWKLMMFPEKAIDYVVVHELCHLSHMNHDRSFWRLVGKHCPSYKEDMTILGAEKTRGL